MSEIEHVAGKRYRMTMPDGFGYLFVAHQDIMVTVPDENAHKTAEKRALAECCCRLASKGMAAGLPMAEIIAQFRAADHGRSGILTEIADKMELFCQGEKA